MTNKGGLTEFLARLRAFESGIDPDKWDWYREMLDKTVLSYPRVISPGHLCRDYLTGQPIFDQVTIREYFERLGVNSMFRESDKSSALEMQYNSINPLGYIGYQLGEAILISTGYYLPEKRTVVFCRREIEVERYYFGGCAAPDNWTRGRTDYVCIPKGLDRPIMATDRNCWRGTFTGKHGVHSLAELKSPILQEKVIREVLRLNLFELQRLWNSLSLPIEKLHSGEFSSTSDCTKCYTLSGVLAAAHLLGVNAVTDFVSNGTLRYDEFGTSIVNYLNVFSDYRLDIDEIFAEPHNQEGA